MTSPIISSPHLCKETGSSNASRAATEKEPLQPGSEPAGQALALRLAGLRLHALSDELPDRLGARPDPMFGAPCVQGVDLRLADHKLNSHVFLLHPKPMAHLPMSRNIRAPLKLHKSLDSDLHNLHVRYQSNGDSDMTRPNITLVQHADHLADSFMGDVRVVRRAGKWAMAVRGDGGIWHHSGTGPKATIVKLATLAIPHKYPALFTLAVQP